jgi:hypothetical protein
VIAAVGGATAIDLARGCASDHCLSMAWKLKHQLDPSYSHGAALMPLTGSVPHWMAAHKTARKRVQRAWQIGYHTDLIERWKHEDAIYAINTSAAWRQGRPMGDAYQEKPVYGRDEPMLCPRHHVYTHGVFDKNGSLRGYLWLYRCGELALVSSILGHHDFMEDGIMYLLYAAMLDTQFELGGTLMYNLWDSGTDGLRFFKERVGLAKGDVDWCLS